MRDIVLAGLLAALPASAALADQVVIETAQGEVALPADPQSVAVYDMAALDTLAALGVTPTGTIDRILVPALQDAAPGAAAVGTLFEPDLEALAGLAPDLVIVGGRSSAQLQAVKQVAPAIDMTIGTDLVGDARARIDAYGKLFAKDAEAARLSETLDDKLAALRAAVDPDDTALVVMTNGPKMSTYGKGSRFGWIFETTGLAEAVPGLDDASHGQAISHEFIAEADPDWLLVLDRTAAIGAEGQAAAETLKSDLVAGTTAWQQGQVIMLDPASTYISAGGFTSLTGTIDRLTQAFTDASSS
ncbi:siderophore ABC transporter substrate-binding protein [Paracoccus rhizosphaerae]|uniref:Siderophore ABC transporter substrate-binding protein n=1 Tax=Paracoccus rhizosphaerae TaxID=1133347 RepID=A0ABV6CIR6_9RHOB|nr:siderophore ABC transporter substrate-binding protein [Paracoccus rhizosphaerae]